MDLLEGSEVSQEMRFVFREVLREKTITQRKQKRDAELVGRREMNVDNLYDGHEKMMTHEDIEAIAIRLKKKKGGRESHYKDLYSLQAALSFSGKGFGEVFMRVDGALPALVRDLSGQDAALQLRATYCCANLSLAGAEVGLKVTKAAAPYLMTHIRGMNQILLEASLWAVGSLSGSGIPAYNILEAQGIYPQIIAVMQRCHLPISAVSPLQENAKSKEQESQVIEAVLYASAHCVSTGLLNGIKSTEIEALAAASIPLLDRAESNFLARLVFLFFLLSSSEASEKVFLESNFLNKIILLTNEILLLITDGNNEYGSEGLPVQVLTYVIRTFGNLSCSERGRSKFESISEIACPVLHHLMKTLTYLPLHLHKETLWFTVQLLKPHTVWSNRVLNASHCPWTSILPLVNSSLEMHYKKLALKTTVLSMETAS